MSNLPNKQEILLLATKKPARLIDLRQFSTLTPLALLVDTTDHRKVGDMDNEYATLSYCWGKAPFYQTTLSNLEANHSEIPYVQLPKTFQHSFIITKSLGINYLWIDALCIIQDSKLDWEVESTKMASIYSNSRACIAADSSTSPHGGCFNFKSSSMYNVVTELVSPLNDGRESRLYLYLADLLKRGDQLRQPQPVIRHGEVAKRAWTFQERLLSPRTLHYTSGLLYWECRKTYDADDEIPSRTFYSRLATFSNIIDSFPMIGEPDVATFNRINHWYRTLLPDYTGRELTYHADRLPAISGLARVFSGYLSGPYLADLWMDHLDYGLTWRRSYGPAPEIQNPRTLTFSWVSYNAQVRWEGSPERDPIVKVLSYDIKPQYQDPYGCIASGWIKIRGHVQEARIERERCPKHPNEENWVVKRSSPQTDSQYFGAAKMDFQPISEDVWCLAVNHTKVNLIVLLLRPISLTDMRFARIGVLDIAYNLSVHGVYRFRDEIWDCPCARRENEHEIRPYKYRWEDWFGDSPIRDITIV